MYAVAIYKPVTTSIEPQELVKKEVYELGKNLKVDDDAINEVLITS